MINRILVTALAFSLFISCNSEKGPGSGEMKTVVADNSEKIKDLTAVIDLLNELDEKIILSEKLIKLWVAEQTVSDNQDKQELKKIIETEIPSIQKKLEEKKKIFTKKQQKKNQSLNENINLLFNNYNDVMTLLSSFASYDDPLNVFEAEEMIAGGGEINSKTKEIRNDIQRLLYDVDKELAKIEK